MGGELVRCDHCGPLGWTRSAYGAIAHKHDCPHRTDEFCQAHPIGCDKAAVDQRGLRVVPFPIAA